LFPAFSVLTWLFQASISAGLVMGLPRVFFPIAFAAPLFFTAASIPAQNPPPALFNSKSDLPAATLKVCLRLQDETPFLGPATVRVMPEEGNELLGMPADVPGEYLFSGVTSGKYVAVVGAPGYDVLSLGFKIDEGPRQKSLFIPMTPTHFAPPEPIAKTPTSAALAPSSESSAVSTSLRKLVPATEPEPGPANLIAGERDFWGAHELEETVPAVDSSISCPCDDILHGVGERMTEFVQSLERFTATEKLEHFAVNRSGARKSPETRTFAYVASVQQNSIGTFLLDEFRDGKVDAEQFPAHTASRGSPAMALIFHPILAPDFEFRCEGLGQWAGRAAWQVHFVQRPDHPIRIRSYTAGGHSSGLALEGRVWIDPGNYQVLRLESELVKPIPDVALTHEHFTIDYQPVRFRSTGQQLWLPQTAELYVERKGRRFYRRHTYSNFMLFNVDASQRIQPVGESFSFTNSSDRDVRGELTVARRDAVSGEPVTLSFTIPAHGKIFKLVGAGKDINLPVTAVGDATFTHEGDPNAIKVDTHLAKQSSVDVIPHTAVPLLP
jgi:hypothetical protein